MYASLNHLLSHYFRMYYNVKSEFDDHIRLSKL